jgi:sugar lactone lactonase YvrE
MKRAVFPACGLVLIIIVLNLAADQKIETVNGIRVVHNVKGGAWGTSPKIALKLIQTIGDVNTADENFAFNSPLDIVLDASGNIYVLDSGNQRIQKFSPHGKHLATIGRKGQGPGEFTYPASLDVDAQGDLYVLDDGQKRIQVFTAGGRPVKTLPSIKLSLDQVRRLASGSFIARSQSHIALRGEKEDRRIPRLLELLDPEMKVIKEFGEIFDYGDDQTNMAGNYFRFAIDEKDNILLGFVYQNRVEKYAADGRLLWRADREINYPTKLLEKGKIVTSGGRTLSYTAPKMNRVVSGIAADDKGRVWVATFNRQIKKQEEVDVNTTSWANGEVARKITGNTDLQTTDMFKLEVFDPEGLLLGEIPVSQFVDGLYIRKDKLFMLDCDRGVKYYEYQIIEK